MLILTKGIYDQTETGSYYYIYIISKLEDSGQMKGKPCEHQNQNILLVIHQ